MTQQCNLQLICGRSGSGKTSLLCKELIQKSIENPKGHYYMIVPEQNTMSTQKQLASMHPDGGTMDIDIVSFVRLTHRVFEELHIKKDKVLEDVGKTMVIRHLLEQNQDKLEIFGKSYKRPGFHQEMKSMICELFQYGISQDDVKRTMESLEQDTILYKKLKDLLLIYQEFEKYMEGNYIVAEQLLTLVSDYVAQSEKLKGATLCFDGFTGFTPVQYVLLEKLMQVVGDIKISITMPEPDNSFGKEYHLFHMSYEMQQRVLKLAAKVPEVQILEPVYLDMVKGQCRLASEELLHLEKNLFVYPFATWKEQMKDVQVFSAKTARQELMMVAGKIRQLVIEEGYRYQDIAIVSGDLSNISLLAEEIMTQYEVPCFIDSNVSLKQNAFAAWILSAWKMAAYDYTYEDVFSYLKSGLSLALDMDEVGRLENYALARGVTRRYSWEREIPEYLSDEQNANHRSVEKLRQAFLQEMDILHEHLQGNTVRSYVEALYRFCVKLSIEEKLDQKRQFFEENKQYGLAKLYAQIYGKVMNLFDKIVDILGNQQMSKEEFASVLETGIDSLNVGVLPFGIDQVIIGDIERTRLNDIKVLFFINVNDTIIPNSGTKAMILSDRDREVLAAELELAPNAHKRTYQEQFYLYLNLTKPSQKLFLSYYQLDEENKEIRKSYLISRLQSIFPKLAVVRWEDVPVMQRMYGLEDGKLQYIDMLKRYFDGEQLTTEEFAMMQTLLMQFTDTKREEAILMGLQYPVLDEHLSKDLARALYGERVTVSVSRLEKYASCAFAYFLEYGLRLKERKLFQLDTADTGSILHETMEKVFDYFQKKQNGMRLASVEDCVKKTKETLKEVIDSDAYKEIFESSNRTTYLHSILERVAVRSITTLKKHLAAGDMEPTAFEMEFGGKKSQYASFQLKDNVTLGLKGVVDRVDVFADEDSKTLYVQVIDYKSGAKHLDYTKLYYGTQLQLVVYMNVIREWAKETYHGMKVVPVGMYYYHMHDPMVTVEGNQETEIQRDSAMRLSGLSLMDDTAIGHVDSLPGAVVEVSKLKSGGYSKASKVASHEMFEGICNHANKMVAKLGNAIYDGEIAAKPYKQGTATGCDYCKFASVCLFDNKCKAHVYRYFAKKDKEVYLSREVDR